MLDRLRLTENFFRSKYESKNAKNSLKHCRLSYLIIRINLLLAVVLFPIKVQEFRHIETMDPSYTQDLRNHPEKHPETPTDAVLIIVSMIREVF